MGRLGVHAQTIMMSPRTRAGRFARDRVGFRRHDELQFPMFPGIDFSRSLP